MVTVFTPTYNRAYILPKLYESLKEQTNNDFEWIVVDDGSTDETERLVKAWIDDSNKFDIYYCKQENGGKHRAINKGVQLARGRLFFVVDSDDYLTPDAVETLIAWEKQLENDKQKFCGVAGEKASIKDGKLMGTANNYGEYVDATALERDKYNIYGDKAEAFYTELLKRYPFPEIDGEKFITENVVWYRIANDGYLLRWYNKPIYMCEYREDGLTRQGNKLFTNNPQGYALSVRERCKFRNTKMKDKILEAYYFYENMKDSLSVNEAVHMLEFPCWCVMGIYAQKLNVVLRRLGLRKRKIP